MIKEWLENLVIGKILKSKKFWYTVVGIVVTFLHDTFGLDPAQTENIIYSIIALILGQGIADFGKEKVCLEKDCAKK